MLRKLKEGQSTFRKPSTGRISKATQRVRDIIEGQMQKDDETTAAELDCILQANGIKLSRSTILRYCRQLGWTYRGAAYCHLIREPNKLKRLSWCMENQNDDFHNVIWTDETTVQLENHRRFSHRKRGEKPRPKPKYAYVVCMYSMYMYVQRLPYYTFRLKHPVKIHVWAGISMNG